MIAKAERWLLPVAGLAWLLLMPVLRVAKPRQATVLSIGDGDTLRVKQWGKTITVRLACIDAPEIAEQPHGQRAREYLQMRLPVGAQVQLDVKTTDRYGRTVAEVIGGINLGLALVEDGMACPLRGPAATPTAST